MCPFVCRQFQLKIDNYKKKEEEKRRWKKSKYDVNNNDVF